jgi:hypothetical protein
VSNNRKCISGVMQPPLLPSSKPVSRADKSVGIDAYVSPRRRHWSSTNATSAKKRGLRMCIRSASWEARQQSISLCPAALRVPSS